MKRIILFLLCINSMLLASKPKPFHRLKRTRRAKTTRNNRFNQNKTKKYLASRKTKETRFNEALRILHFDLTKHSEVKYTQKDITWMQQQIVWFALKNPVITKNIPSRLQSSFNAIKKALKKSLTPSKEVLNYKKLFTGTILDRAKLETFITLNFLNGTLEKEILDTLNDLRQQCKKHLDKSALELLEDKQIALEMMQQEKWMREEFTAASQNTQIHHQSGESQ